MKKQLSLLILLLVLVPFFAQAQDASFENYVPPPLFGEQKLPPPKKTYKSQKPQKIQKPQKNLTIPSLSKPPEEIRKAAPRVHKKLEFLKPVPLPITKPTIKPSFQPQNKIEAVPAPEPIDLLKEQKQIPLAKIPDKPKKPDKKIDSKTIGSKGIVRGSKTMPAHKKSKVDAEVTFESPNQETPDLLGRVQKQNKKPPMAVVTEEKIQPIAESAILLPAFDVQADGRKKIVMIYAGSETSLDGAKKDILMRGIIPALDQNISAKLRIQAYAGPQGEALSMDRRLALSRALAIRSYLLEQEISARRIDVRALGAQSDVRPLDRVELFISP